MTADLLVAVRSPPALVHGLTTAVSIGVQGTGPVTDVCLIGPDGTCVPRFPQFTLVSILAGWETDTFTTVRILTGPAYAHADEGAFAWQGRVDLTIPVLWRLSLALAGRAAFVPNYRGDSFRLGSVEMGLRFR